MIYIRFEGYQGEDNRWVSPIQNIVKLAPLNCMQKRYDNVAINKIKHDLETAYQEKARVSHENYQPQKESDSEDLEHDENDS